jgi:hypothetical protein
MKTFEEFINEVDNPSMELQEIFDIVSNANRALKQAKDLGDRLTSSEPHFQRNFNILKQSLEAAFVGSAKTAQLLHQMVGQ